MAKHSQGETTLSVTTDDGATGSTLGQDGSATLTHSATASTTVGADGAVTSTNSSGTLNLAQVERPGEVGYIRMPWRVGQVTWEDSGEVVLYTVPAGHELWVFRALVKPDGNWDGTGAAIDFGVQTADPDGFVDFSKTGSPVDLTSTLPQPTRNDLQGELLYDDTNASDLLARGAAGTVITATVTPGSGASAGAADMWLDCVLVAV